MRWVTRRNIRVNRTATAWLIRRFIDPEATFALVEPRGGQGRSAGDQCHRVRRARRALPQKDTQGRCSFEALVEEHRPDDPALQRLAVIVRSADFPEALSLTPEGAGLRGISRGFPLVARDDHETAERAAILYDALYAALQERPTSAR